MIRTAPDSYVLPETTFLAAIGCLDLLYTVYLIATGQAHEANPLMGASLHAFGPWGFVILKALLLAVPLTVAELARKRHPVFVRAALRIGIVLYVGVYALMYARYDV